MGSTPTEQSLVQKLKDKAAQCRQLNPDGEQRFGSDATALKPAPINTEAQADALLCELANLVTRRTIDTQRANGKRGWHCEQECGVEQLRCRLMGAAVKGDMDDVMVLAAMIYARQAMAEIHT